MPHKNSVYFRDYNKLPLGGEIDEVNPLTRQLMKQALKMEFNSFYYPSAASTFVFHDQEAYEKILKDAQEQLMQTNEKDQ